MKALVGVVAVALVVLVAAFVLVPTEITEGEQGQIQEEVQQLAQEWMDAWRANACEAHQPFFHPDHLVLLNAGKLIKGWDGWMDYCTPALTNRAGWSGDWIDTEVRAISPDAAVLHGTYSGTYSYRDGSPSHHYPVAAMSIYVERTTDGWKIASFYNSNGPYEEADQG
jgi:uncharacterized protein (TIGR02246 family)